MRRKVISTFLCLLLLSTNAACAKPVSTEVVAPLVQVVKASNDPVVVNATYQGKVESGQDIYIISKVAGEVKKVNVKVGESVYGGQTLFTIDDTIARLQVDSANAAYKSAESNAAISTGGQLDLQKISTESQVEQSKLAAENAKKNYDSMLSQKDKLNTTLKDLKADKKDLEKKQSDAQKALTTLSSQLETLNLTIVTLEQALVDYPANAQASKQLITAKASQGALAEHVTLAQAGVTQLSGALGQITSGIAQTESAITTLDNQISSLEVARDQAKNAYDNAKKSQTLNNNTIIPEAKNVADAGLEQAKAAVNLAEEQLKFYTITSPVTGTVAKVNVKAHDMVAQTAPALIIKSEGDVKASFYVSEDTLRKIDTGLPVTVTHGDLVSNGEIIEMEPSIDQTTGLFKVTAAVENRDDTFISGVNVKVSIAFTESAQNALVIPMNAVYFDNNTSYVYTVVNGDTIKRLDIRTGVSNNDYVEVLEGVGVDDLVVTTWSSKLKDGATVRTTQAATESSQIGD